MNYQDYFDGKVIWITGASSGIGEALAVLLSKYDTDLILTARRETELNRVKNRCRYPERIMVLPADLSDYENFAPLLGQIQQRFKRLDMLVNNAGVGQRGFANDTIPSVDEKILHTNVFAPIYLSKLVLPLFSQQNSGHIVTISSVCGYVPVPGYATYCASKHAMQGYFNTLRAEVSQDNITVTVVCPGYIDTNFSYAAFNADGTHHNKRDRAPNHGMSAERCAQKIIRGVAKKRSEVKMGGPEVLAVYLSRFFPRLLGILLKQIVKRWPEKQGKIIKSF